MPLGKQILVNSYGVMSDFKPGDLLHYVSEIVLCVKRHTKIKNRTHPDKCIAECGRT